ncbi:hypothetical protein [Devosia sp. SD17-2]|uniref:hypothetical protein n=1 Tax=Devosia sp. SD17-2 TaxID=2976459 RepID=UPI0023D7E19E|nr:hypothetical protein [Devosia sp. SD17-2]WEJ34820.1 hypothetical protein NYQ88_08495 [Devosia sp. SD17-2]
MLINKSMYPVKAGYSAISTMQGQLGKLQTQLGNGQKAQTLAEMGNDRKVSLATRMRLTKLESFAANIDTVNLRLSFLDQAFTSLNSLKSETRNSATPTSFGENGLVMASLQKDSENRLSQLLETLNLSVAGRYMMGGNKTDAPPVKSMDLIMNGQGAQAGYRTVVNERNSADMGAAENVKLSGLALPQTTIRGPHGNYLTMSSTMFDKLGYEIISISGNDDNIKTNGPTRNPINQTASLASQPAADTEFTVNLTKLDGTKLGPLTFKAVSGTPTAGATPVEFSIDPTSTDNTAKNFHEALIAQTGVGDLDAFSSVSVSNTGTVPNLMKVTGDADGSLQVGLKFTDLPTVGEAVRIGIKKPGGTVETIELIARDPASTVPRKANEYNIGADRRETMENLQTALRAQVGELRADVQNGRLEVLNTPDEKVTIRKNTAVEFGFSQLTAASTTGHNIKVSTTSASGVQSLGVEFVGEVRPGESVTFSVTMPDGSTSEISLSAVTGTPGIGQFKIGDSNAANGRNFAAALKVKLDDVVKTELKSASIYAAANDFFSADGVPRRVNGNPAEAATTMRTGSAADTVIWYTGEVSSTNPRLSATAQVDDATRVGYGVRANEDGLLAMVKTLAAMSVSEYRNDDPTSKARFTAMVERQMKSMSSDTATNEGSVERIALELGVTKSTVGRASERNIAYSGQLASLLSDVETVTMEETAMQLLALKTRLEASYSATAQIANLSLVNYLK